MQIDAAFLRVLVARKVLYAVTAVLHNGDMIKIGNKISDERLRGRQQRRACWLAAALLLASGGIAQKSSAKEVSTSDPISIVVPYGPGGSVDSAARTLAVPLSNALKRPIIILNRPGGSGSIGMAALARSPATGRVIGIGTVSTLAVLPAARGSVPYSPVRSFEPIGIIASAPTAVIVSSKTGFARMEDLVATARARPGELNFGSVGDGSVVHLAGQMFMDSAGIELTHVPYSGMNKLLSDLTAGRIHVLFDQLGSVPSAYFDEGRLRTLALLDTTTSTEARPALDVRMWSGLLAPAGTPRAVIDQLNSALNLALRDPKVNEAFRHLGMSTGGGSPEDLQALILKEQFAWQAAAEAAHWKLTAADFAKGASK